MAEPTITSRATRRVLRTRHELESAADEDLSDIAQDTADNVVEETFSSYLGEVDPAFVKKSKIWLPLAIMFKKTPPIMRHVGVNLIANSARKFRFVPQNMKRPLGIFFRSLPQGIAQMLDRDDFTVEELEKALREAYEGRSEDEVSSAVPADNKTEKWEACVGVDPTQHQIHLKGMHVLKPEQMTNRASEFHIFERFGGIYPTCKICYPDEPGAAAVEEEKEEEKEEVHHSGLLHFKDETVAKAYSLLMSRAREESKLFVDENEGLESRAAKLHTALLYLLDHDDAGAQKLLSPARAAQLIQVIEVNRSLPKAQRVNIFDVFENEINKAISEYERKHPPVAPGSRDMFDALAPFVDDGDLKGGGSAVRKRVIEKVKRWADMALQIGFGGTVAFIVAFLIVAALWSSALAPFVFTVFVISLCGVTAVMWFGRWLGIGVGEKAALATATLFGSSILFTIAFGVATIFTQDTTWLWMSYVLTLANILTADVFAWRHLDDLVSALMTMKTNGVAIIKDIVPFGETGSEYKANEAIHRPVKEQRFKRFIFTIAVVVTTLWIPVGLAGLANLEVRYIAESVVFLIAVVGMSYLRSLISVSNPKDNPEHIQPLNVLEHQANFNLAFRIVKWTMIPVLGFMVFAMCFDPHNLGPKHALANPEQYEGSYTQIARESRLVKLTNTRTSTTLNAWDRHAKGDEYTEAVCQQTQDFILQNPLFCKDEALMGDNPMCVAKRECNISTVGDARPTVASYVIQFTWYGVLLVGGISALFAFLALGQRLISTVQPQKAAGTEEKKEEKAHVPAHG